MIFRTLPVDFKPEFIENQGGMPAKFEILRCYFVPSMAATYFSKRPPSGNFVQSFGHPFAMNLGSFGYLRVPLGTILAALMPICATWGSNRNPKVAQRRRPQEINLFFLRQRGSLRVVADPGRPANLTKT